MKKYHVMVKNFSTRKWETMKLIFDPRTEKEGFAIYDKRKDAVFCRNIALSFSGGQIETKIIIK